MIQEAIFAAAKAELSEIFNKDTAVELSSQIAAKAESEVLAAVVKILKAAGTTAPAKKTRKPRKKSGTKAEAEVAIPPGATAELQAEAQEESSEEESSEATPISEAFARRNNHIEL